MEMTAVKTFSRWGLGATVASAALGLIAATASAQTPAPATTPAPKAPPAATAPKAPAAAKPAAAAPAAKKEVKSACAGLDEATCKSKPECGWVVPTKTNAATGKVQSPYCHKPAGVAVKKTPAAAAPAAKPAAPAATAAKKPVTPPAASQITTTVPPAAK